MTTVDNLRHRRVQPTRSIGWRNHGVGHGRSQGFQILTRISRTLRLRERKRDSDIGWHPTSCGMLEYFGMGPIRKVANEKARQAGGLSRATLGRWETRHAKFSRVRVKERLTREVRSEMKKPRLRERRGFSTEEIQKHDQMPEDHHTGMLTPR